MSNSGAISGGMNMSKKSAMLGSVFVVIAAVLWGLDGVILTPRLYNLPVPFVVFLLHAIPFLFMNVIFFKEYKNLGKLKPMDAVAFGLIALFGGAIGTLSIVKALFLVNFQHLSVVVLLQKLQPVFAVVLARILLKEKIGKNFLLWAGIAIVGAYFLAFGLHTPNFGSEKTALAAMYALLAAFSFGSSTVFGKFVVSSFDFQTALFFRYGFTTIIMTVFLFFTKGFISLTNITKMNWIILLIITFSTGAFAIAMYYFGLKRINANVATICELAYPVSATLFDYFINKSVLSTVQWIAAIIVIFAILQITKNQMNLEKK